MSYEVIVDVDLPEEMLEMIAGRCNLHILSHGTPTDEIYQKADALLTYGHITVNGEVMDQMPNIKVISNFGVGVDHIHLEDAKHRGIPVGNTPNILDGATADMTFALLMAGARNIVIGDHFARSPEFTHYDPRILIGYEVHSTTLGIIGLGNIGKQVARRASGFDMKVLYHNRKPNLEAEAELGVTYATLDDLLTQSDYVALNAPLTDETYHMIGRDQLKRMKPTAFLVNLARGGVVDHDALLEALQNDWIAGAAIDVTEPEPLPRDHPLLKLKNIIIAPHLGSATRQTRTGMAQRTVDNLMAGLEGSALLSRIA
ncbi:MAG: glyoxylate reductase [Candidatus Latescibacterota bacterium]|jgi:glyoxylate reductase